MTNQTLSTLDIWHEQIKHVIRLAAVIRDDRQPNAMLGSPTSELVPIIFPDSATPALNVFPILQLGEKICSQHIRWKITGADVAPCVLIDLAAEKPATVCPFFQNDFRTFHEALVIDQESAPL